MPQDIAFTSASETCRGWLFEPSGSTPAGPPPVIVMAHGLGAVKEMRLPAFAERFCAVGYACLVFDYRHFGASDGEPRQLLDIDRQQQDWAAAIAYARTLPQVDAQRVVLWGSSFSGGHVIHTAARDSRVAAAMVQCPFTDGIASLAATDPRTAVKITWLALRDLAAAARGAKPVMVPLAGPEKSAALLTAPDAMAGYHAMVPQGLDFNDQVAARVGLNILRYRPGREAARVCCPILFCICEKDSVAPARASLKYARRAPRGEIATYPVGHFDIYQGSGFEQVVARELEFLQRHLPLG